MATRSKLAKKSSDHIASVLHEERRFAPSKEFASKAHIGSPRELRALQEYAEGDVVAYWEEQARELAWFAPWKKPLVWKYPHAQWFVGGTTNVAVNCLDRHLGTWRRTKAALIWEGEPGDTRTLTYQQLYAEVCRAANVLEQLGVRKGDVVAI